MTKLWDKGYKLDELVELFETKDDLLLDQKLVKYDVYGSIAHALMLQKIGLLTANEYNKLKTGLLEILELEKKEEFKLIFGDEDVHTKIENYLIEKYGEAGQKNHTARSRNDQVLTAIRLYTKTQLLLIWDEILSLCEGLLKFAKEHEYLPLPGYTHMQKAMPSTVGMWASSFVEGLFDDLVMLKSAYDLNNQLPLGSGASYGIPLPIDREYTSKLLGFKKVQSNSLYCQNSRGKIEGIIISALVSVLSEINKFASDVLLFTTSEFDLFEVDKKLCSGSSIMPQKKNVDVAELLRSKIHLVLGNYVQLVSLSSNLISGYNRDLQDTKKPLFESLDIAFDSIKVTNILINNLKPKKEILEESLTSEFFATHAAYLLVKKGLPFREAYKKIANSLNNLPKFSPKEVIKASSHLGGLGNLGLSNLDKRIKKEGRLWKKENDLFQETIYKLLNNSYES